MLDPLDAQKDREIIRLWNALRALQRDGRPTALVLRKIEQALAERELVEGPRYGT